MTVKDKAFADEYLEWEERQANDKAAAGTSFRTTRRSLEGGSDFGEKAQQDRIRWRRRINRLTAS